MAKPGYDEPIHLLRAETIEMHRAIITLMAELHAVDSYNQRIDACTDEELKYVLIHNRDEEKEHAAMALEWIRRNCSVFDEQLRKYLFTDTPITHT